VPAVVVAACLGLMVGVRSDPVIAAATLVAVAVSTTWRVRVCCAIVGTGMLLGVPWVILPAIAGGVWALWPRPVRVIRRSPGSPRSRVGWTLAAVATGLVAGVLAWAPLLRQLRADPIVMDVVRPSTALVVTAIVAMAVLNGAGEELIWRGALSEAGASLPVPALFVVQAGSFGLAHLHGLPGGAVGVVLAAVFSLACTALHLRAGLWVSVVAHIVADLIIFAAAFPKVSFSGWWTPG
jgi:membrane protease YdiL (CAAX protease family)